MTDSTSTMTNEGESSYEMSSEQHPISYQQLMGLECTTTPSSPSADELEQMRSGGAIPKHYQRHSVQTSRREMSDSTCPSSSSGISRSQAGMDIFPFRLALFII